MNNSIRLAEIEENALEVCFDNVLAPIGEFKVYLFGSRTDLKKRGGDIDLFISYSAPHIDSQMALTRQLRICICERIGEQKIDIVWQQRTNEDSLEEIIKQSKVLLWKTKN